MLLLNKKTLTVQISFKKIIFFLFTCVRDERERERERKESFNRMRDWQRAFSIDSPPVTHIRV